jgi:hypothetical protein
MLAHVIPVNMDGMCRWMPEHSISHSHQYQGTMFAPRWCAGHVLISPQRVEAKFSDLNAAEVADLWQLAQKVSACMQSRFKADSMSLVIQACS